MNEIFILITLACIGGLLNRLRGGLFSNISRDIGWEWGGKQRTTTMRLIWAVPTGLLLWLLTTGTSDWWMLLSLVVSCFAGYALLGHGGHMVFGVDEWVKQWKTNANLTEITTEFWLPALFGGRPQPGWTIARVTLFHVLGMGFIGLLRSTIFMLPLLLSGTHFYGSLALALSGSLLGLLYWLGWSLKDGETSEVIVGAFYWATFYLVLGTAWL